MSKIKHQHVNDLNPFGFHLVEVAIDDIIPYEANPRFISTKKNDDLDQSITKFGLIDKPIINKDMTCIAGHQRINLLKSKGYKMVLVWYPEIQLSEEEVQELLIRHNKNTGSWDENMLVLFDKENLENWGFSPAELDFFDLEDEEDEDNLGTSDEPVYPLSPKFSEKYSYVVIMTTNEIDQVQLETMLGLETAQDYKTSNIGLGRVITYDRFKEAIESHQGTEIQ